MLYAGEKPGMQESQNTVHEKPGDSVVDTFGFRHAAREIPGPMRDETGVSDLPLPEWEDSAFPGNARPLLTGAPLIFFSGKEPTDAVNIDHPPRQESLPGSGETRTRGPGIAGQNRQETVPLRGENDHYQQILEKTREGILVVREGVIVYSNPVLRNIFGKCAPGEMEGHRLTDFVHAMDRDLISAFLDGPARAEKPDRVFTFRIPALGGIVRYLECRSTSIEWDRQPAMLGFITDITEQREAKAALDLANRKIGLLNDLTRHDIANRLTVLRGRVKRARVTTEDPRIIRELDEAESAGRDIFQYLEMARMYQDMGMIFPQWLSLRSLLDSDRILRDIMDLKIILDSPNMEIYADPLCPRVFENLIDNSRRHGNSVSEIRVTAKETDHGLVIILEDNGGGIPPEDKESIFEQGVGKHTGLGLFLSREILSITGITIRETGTFGAGARFEITVPREAYRILSADQGIVLPCT
jgi:PAS domain S-box-containing protein